MLPKLAWAALIASFGACAGFLLQWQHAHRLNAKIGDGTLVQQSALPDDAVVRYAAGWQYEQLLRNDEALVRYAAAAATNDPALRARSEFALGNLYLQIGLRAGDVANGGSHVRGLAQLDLAREAYRTALRLDPELRDARYNLELLERLSPDKRTQGWSRRERRTELQQGQEQGWAGMQESTIHGLP